MEIQKHSNSLFKGVQALIDNARGKVAVFVNAETTLLYWQIGNYVNGELIHEDRAEYGTKIIATLSQQLTVVYGRGYSYSALTRMCKVSKTFDGEKIATLSQQLSWSHLIELAVIDHETKRDFFTQLCVYERWGVRELREKIDTMLFEHTVISTKPEEIIKDALQKLRIPIDSIDYHLDLLFYHRKLKRLIAIDLKLGKFRPRYKSQMELYLRWLQKYEMQEGEEMPLGLLLCSEGNTEHVELLMLDEKHIRVAQYLTELPSKEWFAEKLHRALEIAKMNFPHKP